MSDHEVGKNDRNLLELAAEAAGYDHTGVAYHAIATKAVIGLYLAGDGEAVIWNPLTDDGDALRLAVKLGIMVDPYHGIACVRDIDFTFNPHMIEATRHAIVLAAAEIGRDMK